MPIDHEVTTYFVLYTDEYIELLTNQRICVLALLEIHGSFQNDFPLGVESLTIDTFSFIIELRFGVIWMPAEL